MTHVPPSLARCGWLRRYLRRAFGDAMDHTDGCADTNGVTRMSEHDTALKAVAEHTASAEYLKLVAQKVHEQHDPDNPDSFDTAMRKLLGRLE